jgi:endonuclease-3 related protein
MNAQQRAFFEVYERLETMHEWRGWHWWPDADPFEVAVGCILVQNTMWTNVERAIERLKAVSALSPGAMSALSQDELEELVRPSGQYRQKALKLRAFLDLAERHGGFEALMDLDEETLRTLLLACWGIGPESADAMVCYAARKPAMVNDAYTIRLFSRLGMGPVGSSDYHAWQRWQLESSPAPEVTGWGVRDFQARLHALIVMHGKHLCLKNRPKCGECLLIDRCAYAATIDR